MMRPVLLWAPAIAFAALIFVVSSVPGTSFPAVAIVSFDKFVHACVFGVLGALVALPLERLKLFERRVLLIAVAAVITTTYGVSDELHQRFTPGRSPDPLDVAADAAGAVLGAWAWVSIVQRRKGKARQASS